MGVANALFSLPSSPERGRGEKKESPLKDEDREAGGREEPLYRRRRKCKDVPVLVRVFLGALALTLILPLVIPLVAIAGGLFMGILGLILGLTLGFLGVLLKLSLLGLKAVLGLSALVVSSAPILLLILLVLYLTGALDSEEI